MRLRFESKVDSWLKTVIWISQIIQIAILIFLFLDEPENEIAVVITVLILLLSILFVFWIYFGTFYEVDREYLYVISGPITWRIKLIEINEIKETNDVLSSPDLSSDRLKIKFGRKSIMISPENKDAFVEALGFDLDKVIRRKQNKSRR